jgi:hypothetical protein
MLEAAKEEFLRGLLKKLVIGLEGMLRNRIALKFGSRT